MRTSSLSQDAEVLRNEIKEAIKDARRVLKVVEPPADEVVYLQNQQGDKDYRGDPLGKLATRLVWSLKIGSVYIHCHKLQDFD